LCEGNVQHYCKHGKELKQPLRLKSKLFLEHDCVKYLGDDVEFGNRHTFVVLPLNTDDFCVVDGRSFSKVPFSRDYNYSAYKVVKTGLGVFECNCQGWQNRFRRGEMLMDGCHCSHVLALFYAFKLGKFKKVNKND